jgi:hypothetical protein
VPERDFPLADFFACDVRKRIVPIPGFFSEEVYELCAYCDGEGCGGCDEGLVEHDCSKDLTP